MVDRDHRTPSEAVVQGSPCTASGEAGKDCVTSTITWKKNPSMDDSGNKKQEEESRRSLNKSSAAQHGDEKGKERERHTDLPRKTAGDFAASSPRKPDGTMKRNHPEEREPFPDSMEKASPEKERVKEMPEEEPSNRKKAKDSQRERKVPVGVLKWRKDEEPDETGKGSAGETKVFRMPAILSDKAEELLKKPSHHQRHLRKAVKWLWIPSLLFGSLLIGLIIGYAGLGGQSPMEVFDFELWKHIYQLIYG